MKEAHANRAAELIKARDQAREWIASFRRRDVKAYPLIAMTFAVRKKNGVGRAWGEEYLIPRQLGIAMLERLGADCNTKLRKLGVTP